MKSYITIDGAQCRKHIKSAGLTIRQAAIVLDVNFHTLHNQLLHQRMPSELAKKILMLTAAPSVPAADTRRAISRGLKRASKNNSSWGFTGRRHKPETIIKMREARQRQIAEKGNSHVNV